MRTIALLAGLLLGVSGRSQIGCYDFGSVPTGPTWEASALPLGCSFAPQWPQWHLFTPGHRRPATHRGYNPGNAYPVPRLLVTYRCTGLLFAPVAIARVRFMGYVVDQAEIACAGTD